MQNDHSELDRATEQFWRFGFAASGVAEIIAASDWNRAAIYSTYGDKNGLFAACIDRYVETIVTPAFSVVEKEGARLDAVGRFLETQIRMAEESGLPGPGCLMANTMTELALHDEAVASRVNNHLGRLSAGFARAIINEVNGAIDRKKARQLADFMTTSIQGLWAKSRTVSRAAPLREYATTLIGLVRNEIHAK